MNLPQSLLELAQSMAKMDAKRPRQATLRRAISTAYYSVFHLLTTEYAALYSSDPVAKAAIARTVNHKDIAAIARDFSSSTPVMPESLKSKGVVVTPELSAVARAFSELQDERHDADYDVSFTYTRIEAEAILTIARNAFKNWNTAKSSPAAKLFLACFQLKKAWNEKR